MAVDTWLAANSPDWPGAELNPRLREKAIAVYIGEGNDDFLKAYQAIGASEWFYFGRVAFSMKRFKSAAAAFERASQLSGASVDSDYWRIKAITEDSWADSSQVEAAVQALSNFAEKYPNHVGARRDMVKLLARLGRLKEAFLRVFVYCDEELGPSEGGKKALACANQQMRDLGREFGFVWVPL